ncbi:zinc-ribbon domain-containing protein, partial [Clostridium perfringens]|nr:zinc-ribbon domain-containing protein [Clostridium perfringens]
MKFCTKCGNKLSDSMKFCNKCGAKVKSVDKDTENNSDTEDKKDIPNSKNNIDKTIILDAPKIKKEINTNINENIKNNFKPLHDSNFNNKEEYLDASFDDDLDENFNDESYHNEDIDNFKHSNTKKKILISIFTLVAFVIIGTSIYFLRSPLLYKYYYNSALKSSSVTEKLSYYNSALKYSKNDDLLNS